MSDPCFDLLANAMKRKTCSASSWLMLMLSLYCDNCFFLEVVCDIPWFLSAYRWLRSMIMISWSSWSWPSNTASQSCSKTLMSTSILLSIMCSTKTSKVKCLGINLSCLVFHLHGSVLNQQNQEIQPNLLSISSQEDFRNSLSCFSESLGIAAILFISFHGDSVTCCVRLFVSPCTSWKEMWI